MTGCEIWTSKAGPCNEPEVERLCYLNSWMDYHGCGQGQVQTIGVNPSNRWIEVKRRPSPVARVVGSSASGLAVCDYHLTEYRREQLL